MTRQEPFRLKRIDVDAAIGVIIHGQAVVRAAEKMRFHLLVLGMHNRHVAVFTDECNARSATRAEVLRDSARLVQRSEVRRSTLE